MERGLRTSALPASELFSANTPAAFWRLTGPQPSSADWAAAVRTAASDLPASMRQVDDLKTLVWLTLGEGQFGPRHWQMGLTQRLYYAMKPALPRWGTRLLRRLYRRSPETHFRLGRPIEAPYARVSCS